MTEEKPAKLTEQADDKPAELSEEARQWLAGQQRFFAEFYDNYGREDGPGQPEAPAAQ